MIPKTMLLPTFKDVKTLTDVINWINQINKSLNTFYSGLYNLEVTNLSQIKIGSFTRDTSLASGNQSITTDFRPRVVIFFANQHGSNEISLGFDDLSNTFCLYYNPTGTIWGKNETYSIYDEESAAVDYYTGKILSLDDLGFTISWTKTGSPTGTLTIGYLALG